MYIVARDFHKNLLKGVWGKCLAEWIKFELNFHNLIFVPSLLSFRIRRTLFNIQAEFLMWKSGLLAIFVIVNYSWYDKVGKRLKNLRKLRFDLWPFLEMLIYEIFRFLRNDNWLALLSKICLPHFPQPTEPSKIKYKDLLRIWLWHWNFKLLSLNGKTRFSVEKMREKFCCSVLLLLRGL